MSDLDPKTQQAIKDGEDAWRKVTSGNWDESGWRIMGTALILLRQQVLHDLGGKNVARGSIYNTAFARRLDGTAFKTMDPSTRSNLLFCMEPANRIVLDKLMAEWTPDQRARRTHPATLARAIRAAQRPPKPPPQPDHKPQAKPNEDVRLDMISTKTGREQAEIFMRQYAKRMEWEIRERVEARIAVWQAEMLPEYKKRLEAADHIVKTRKGFMKKALFNKFRFAIHEDTYNSRSAKERAELCQWLEEHETVLVAEAEKPSTLPSWDELMRNREKQRQANSERSKAAHARAKAKREGQ